MANESLLEESKGTVKSPKGETGASSPLKTNLTIFPKTYQGLSRRCGSVDWVSSCKPKGCRFDSQSGHMPGLRVWSPVRTHTDVSLPLFLPPFPAL